jgi:hypothetical protein
MAVAIYVTGISTPEVHRIPTTSRDANSGRAFFTQLWNQRG